MKTVHCDKIRDRVPGKYVKFQSKYQKIVMRLTENQVKSIKETFRTFFQERDHIWLFGSRTNPLKKGGDIDLYIETHYQDMAIVAEKQIAFLVELKRKIGDQKIDLIINRLTQDKVLSIYEEAKNTGVLIV